MKFNEQELSRADAVKELQEITGITLKIDRELTNLMLVNMYDFSHLTDEISKIAGEPELGMNGTAVEDFVISKWGERTADLIEYVFYLTHKYDKEREKVLDFGVKRLMNVICYDDEADVNDEWVKLRDELNEIVGFKIRFNLLDSVEVKTPIIDGDHFIEKTEMYKEYDECNQPEDFSTHLFVKVKYGERAAKLMGFFVTGDINADLEQMHKDMNEMTPNEFIDKHIMPKL